MRRERLLLYAVCRYAAVTPMIFFAAAMFSITILIAAMMPCLFSA